MCYNHKAILYLVFFIGDYIMQIIKRSGQAENYQPHKIKEAIRRAFSSTSESISEEILENLLKAVQDKLTPDVNWSVEQIQDLVERTLMEQGFYETAKSYILYRQKRFELRKERKLFLNDFPSNQLFEQEDLENCFLKIQTDFSEDIYQLKILHSKFHSFFKPEMNLDDKFHALIKAAVELTTSEAPKWEFIAARLLSFQFHYHLKYEEEKRNIRNLYEKIFYLTEEGLYGDYILKHY